MTDAPAIRGQRRRTYYSWKAMKDKLDINLRVADTSLSLNIKYEEEELLRRAAKEVNHAWSIWRQDERFRRKTPHEVLAMVTLLFAQGYLSLKGRAADLESLLAGFDEELDRLLADD